MRGRYAFIMETPWKPGHPAQVVGFGVLLRSMSPSDIDDAFIAQLRDPQVSSHLGLGRNPSALSRENLLKMLAGFDNRQSFWFGIWPEAGGERLGFIWASISWAGVASITLAITERAQWGQGAGSAA